MKSYYILSLKWSKASDRVLTWWGPNNSNYVFRLESAGRYTQAEIDADRTYYDNGDSTRAVPCEVAEAVAEPVEGVESRAIERRLPGTDRVVRYKHIRSLRRPRADAERLEKAHAPAGPAAVVSTNRDTPDAVVS